MPFVMAPQAEFHMQILQGLSSPLDLFHVLEPATRRGLWYYFDKLFSRNIFICLEVVVRAYVVTYIS